MAYAALDDLEDVGLPPGALQGVSTEAKERALDMASARADAYLRDQYRLPLVEPYDPALVDAVVQIAAARLMRRRGFNPSSAGDASIQLGFDESIAFLQRVANGQVRLLLTSQDSPEYTEPQLITSPQRGYAGGGAPLGPWDGGL